MSDDTTNVSLDSLPTSEEQPTETVQEEGVSEDQGSEPSQSEEQTSAPSKENDPLSLLETMEIDPKTKEILKAGFMRQSDYTKKTQEVAEVRKAAEAYQKWTPVIRYLEQNPNAAKAMFAVGQPKKETPEEELELPEDPKEFFKLAVAKGKEEALSEVREWQRQEAQKQEAQRQLDTQIAESEKLDSRLTNDETFAKWVAGWMEINYGQQIRGNEISIPEATKLALDAHKQYEESLKQKFLLDLDEKTKKKTMVIPSGNGSPLSTANKGGKMSMREAALKAEEEIGSR